jgi:hypothetical protein
MRKFPYFTLWVAPRVSSAGEKLYKVRVIHTSLDSHGCLEFALQWAGHERLRCHSRAYPGINIIVVAVGRELIRAFGNLVIPQVRKTTN